MLANICPRARAKNTGGFLAAWSPLEAKFPNNSHNSGVNQVVDTSEWVFQIIFTIEMALKITAHGLLFKIKEGGGIGIKKDAYLADPWNIMDAVVVSLGWVALAPSSSGGANLSSIRVVRVLRPLRTISAVPKLRLIVNALLASIPPLANVLVLLFFFFAFYGIVGVQLFQRKTQQMCLDTSAPGARFQNGVWYMDEPWVWDGLMCSNDTSGTLGTVNCGKLPSSASNDTTCVVFHESPSNNVVNFNNWGNAFLVILVSIALEGWSDYMYWTEQSTTAWAEVYWVTMIWLGGFFALSLVIAVLFAHLTEEMEKEHAKLRQKKEAQTRVVAALRARRRRTSAAALFEFPAQQSADSDADQGQGVLAGGSAVTSPGLQKLYAQMSEIGSLVKDFGLEKGQAAASSTSLAVVAADSGEDGQLHERGGFPEFLASAERFVLVARSCAEAGDETGANEALKAASSILSQYYAAPNAVAPVESGLEWPVDELLVQARPGPDASVSTKVSYLIISKWWFDPFIVLCIIGNTVALAIAHHDQPKEWDDALFAVNLVLTVIFTIEMLLKMKGLGLNLYLSSSWNVFDMSVVGLSWLEIALLNVTGASGGGGLTALRAFRLLRVVRIARSWKSLNQIVSNAGRALNTVWPAGLLLVIFMLIFALMGKQVYGGLLYFDEADVLAGSLAIDCPNNTELLPYYPYCPHRENFDDTLWSLVTVFQVFGQKIGMLYPTIGAAGYGAAVFYVLLIFIGNFIVLNLFLVILLDAFTKEVEPEEEELQEKITQEAKEKVLARQLEAERLLQKAVALREARSAEEGSRAGEGVLAAKEEGATGAVEAEEEGEVPITSGSEDADAARRFQSLRTVLTRQLNERIAVDPELEDLPSFKFTSLNIFLPNSDVRQGCAKLALSRWFDMFILLVIVVACILLALDQPATCGVYAPLYPYPVPTWSGEACNALEQVDVAVTVIFTVEALVKIIAFGFVQHEGSYLRDPWNVLDFVVVILSLVSVGTGGSAQLGAFKSLRALRAFRALRLVRRLEGLRVITLALARSVPRILEVLLVVAVGYLITGILAYNFFGGRLYRCNDPTRDCFVFENQAVQDCPMERRCVGEFLDPSTGQLVLRRWENPRYTELGDVTSFDSTPQSMLLLFEVSGLEVWPITMYRTTDITRFGHAPARFSNDIATVFFMFFIVFSSFFLVQLFVSVVVSSYNDERDSHTGSAFMTESQQRWVAMQRMAASLRYRAPWKKPSNAFRAFWFRVVTSRAFEVFIMTCIVLNTLVLMIDHWPADPTFSMFIVVANGVFGAIYTVEAVLKLTGLGRQYWSTYWNWFDFFIVLAYLVGLVLTLTIGARDLTIINIFRVLRIVRIFRLLNFLQGLKKLLNTLLLALPPLANIVALTLLIYFVFAIIGMALFGGLRGCNDCFANFYSNFTTFHRAMLFLFRFNTGESWHVLMRECALINPLAYPYFIVFIIGALLCGAVALPSSPPPPPLSHSFVILVSSSHSRPRCAMVIPPRTSKHTLV